MENLQIVITNNSQEFNHNVNDIFNDNFLLLNQQQSSRLDVFQLLSSVGLLVQYVKQQEFNVGYIHLFAPEIARFRRFTYSDYFWLNDSIDNKLTQQCVSHSMLKSTPANQIIPNLNQHYQVNDDFTCLPIFAVKTESGFKIKAFSSFNFNELTSDDFDPNIHSVLCLMKHDIVFLGLVVAVNDDVVKTTIDELQQCFYNAYYVAIVHKTIDENGNVYHIDAVGSTRLQSTFSMYDNQKLSDGRISSFIEYLHEKQDVDCVFVNLM